MALTALSGRSFLRIRWRVGGDNRLTDSSDLRKYIGATSIVSGGTWKLCHFGDGGCPSRQISGALNTTNPIYWLPTTPAPYAHPPNLLSVL
jgi:hypothetical protein